MRFARYAFAELLIAASTLVGAGVVAGWASSALIHRATDAALERRLGALELRRRVELSAPSDPPIDTEPAGTFLGMADDLLLSRVKTQPIKQVKVNKGGSSLSFRVDFADGSRAAFKPAQTNLQTIPRKEVAAYRLNRLLGLNAVPPATPRQVSRDELLAHLHPDSQAALPRIQAETIFNPLGKTWGVFSYWVPEIKDSGLDTPEGIDESFRWLTQGASIPVEKRGLAQQFSNLVVFDFLTSNPDRYSGGNMKMSPDGERLYFMDNTLAFFLDPQGPEKNRNLLQRAQRFSRRLYQALERVTVDQLEQTLADSAGGDPHEILTAAEIRAVVARRDVVRRHIDALSALHGSHNVLVFP